MRAISRELALRYLRWASQPYVARGHSSATPGAPACCPAILWPTLSIDAWDWERECMVNGPAPIIEAPAEAVYGVMIDSFRRPTVLRIRAAAASEVRGGKARALPRLVRATSWGIGNGPTYGPRTEYVGLPAIPGPAIPAHSGVSGDIRRAVPLLAALAASPNHTWERVRLPNSASASYSIGAAHLDVPSPLGAAFGELTITTSDPEIAAAAVAAVLGEGAMPQLQDTAT